MPSSMPQPRSRTLQLFTEVPTEAEQLTVGSESFPLPPWRGCAFATFWVREAQTLPPPIDAGIAGPCIRERHCAILADATLDGWPLRAPAVPEGARWVTLRVYAQPNETLDAPPLGELRTYELVFTHVPPTPLAQAHRHRSIVFSCGPLGFAFACPSALAAHCTHLGHDDLIACFTTTDDADPFMARGELLPILGVHAWTYRLVVASQALDGYDTEVLGKEVLAPRRQRVRGEEGMLSIVDGESFRHFHRRRVNARLPWTDVRTVTVRGFTHGPHGEGLIPTYVLEPTELEPAGPPILNEDLGELFERST